MLDGENICDKRTDVVQLRQRVGMVSQRPNPFPKSIFENVAYGLRVQGKSNSYIKNAVCAPSSAVIPKGLTSVAPNGLRKPGSG